MKKLMIAVAMMVASSGIATANDYQLDPKHSNARFYIDHFQTSTNHGGFYELTGDVSYNPDAQTGYVAVEIPTSAINTGVASFDEHMKNPDLLNTEQFPTMEFKSTEWKFDGKKPTQIIGNLTLMGKTQPVTLDMTKFNCYDNPMFQKEVCGGDFTTTIDRTQWGIDFLVESGMTKDVVIQIQVEAIKKDQ